MTLYYDDNRGTDRFTLQDFEPSFGMKMDNAVREAWLESYGPVLTDRLELSRRGNQGPKLPAAEAAERIKASGLRLDLTPKDGQYTEAQLEFLLERQRELTMIRDVRDRTPWDLGSPVRGVAMFGAGILDPINLATAFVPWSRAIPAAQGLRAASLSASAATRTAGRAGFGAIDGGISTAVLEPFYFGMRQSLGDDYDAYDSMLNIGFGAAFGGGVIAGGGAGVDLFRRAMGREQPFDAYRGLSVEQIQQVQGLRAEIANGMDLRDAQRVLDTYTPEMRRAAGFPDPEAPPVAPADPAPAAPAARAADVTAMMDPELRPPSRTADEMDVPQTTRRNDLAVFLRDTGGLAPSLARDAGGDTAVQMNRQLAGIVNRNGAENYDQLTERLIEDGFLPAGMDSGSIEAADMAADLVARALNGERILRIEGQLAEMELRQREEFDAADRERFESDLEARLEREAIQGEGRAVSEPEPMIDRIPFFEPETREAALRAGVAQAAEGRMIDVDAILNTDEAVGATAGMEQIADAAQRNRQPEAIRVADFEAAAAVDERNAAAPKWDALTDAEKAAAEADAMLADTVKAGENAFKYSRGEAPGQKKAALWQGTTARFSPEEGAPLGRFRWDFINSEGGEQAQAFGYGHYLAQQAWISQTRYRERLIGRKKDSLDRYTIPDGAGGVMELSRRNNDAAWQMPDGTILHASQKDPKLAAMADAVAQVDRYGYAEAKKTFQNILQANQEFLERKFRRFDELLAEAGPIERTGLEPDFARQRADLQAEVDKDVANLAMLDEVTEVAATDIVEKNGRWYASWRDSQGLNVADFATEAEARAFAPRTLAPGIKKYDPPQPENLRERVVAGGQEITGELELFILTDTVNMVDQFKQTLGRSLDETAADVRGTNLNIQIADMLDDLSVRKSASIKPIVAELEALQARGIDTITLERPGSLYRAEMDAADFQNLLLWDAPMSEQPAKVRDAFERLGVYKDRPPLTWKEAQGGELLATSFEGVQLKISESFPGIYRLFVNRKAYGREFSSVAQAQENAERIFNFQVDGEDVYRALVEKIERLELDTSIVDRALDEIALRRGERRPIGGAPELASVILHQAGIPGHAFLDGVSRNNTDLPAYNIVIYSDDVAKIVDRYARQTGEIGRATDTPEGLTEALRLSFGRDTDAMIKAGRVQVVATPADIPGGPHPGDVKAATAPDGTVYVVAENVSELEARGILLHEVGVHVGMERMLGSDVFGSVLTELDDAIARGESWAQAARAAVPADTLPMHVREEQLAYLVQNAPELPIVQRILAAVRAWAYRTFQFARERMTLTEGDFRAMAVSALHHAAREGRAGQGAMVPAFSRDVPQTETKAFRDWFGGSKVVDENGKPLVVYHGTDADITEFKVSERGTYGGGIYLTPDTEGANDYAIYRGSKNPTVYPLYVSIKNPATGAEAARVASWKGEENARAELIARGYDGVIDARSGEIVAFYPEQIKSAIGNRGTFDPTNPDIRYSRGETPDPSTADQILKRYDDAVARAKSYSGVLRAAADKLDNDAQAIAAMRQALPSITENEIADLLSQLRKQVQGLRGAVRQARSAISAEDTAGVLQAEAMRAADMLANNLEMAAVIEKRNAALNVNARLKATSFVNQFRDKGLDFEGFAALLVGSERVRTGSRVSIDAEYKGFRGEWVGGMIADVEKRGLMRDFISGVFDRDIYDALWRMGTESPDLAGLPPQAVQLAEIINKYQTDARNTRNRFGAWIRDLQGYITRQSHDMYKIREVTDAEWIDFVKDKIDIAKMTQLGLISETDPISSLRGLYDDFAAGVHMKAVVAEDDLGAFGRGSNLARRESVSRAIYFKDGLAAYEYNERFGYGRLAESVLHGLDHAARSASLMKTLGTNPEATFTRLLDEYEATLAPDPARRSKFREKRGTLMNMLAQVDGSVFIPGNVTGAKIGAFLRAWQTMAKLGGALISSFSDLAGYGAELRYAQGKGMLSGVADGMGALVRGRAKDERLAITSSLGVFHESIAGSVMARFDSPDLMGGKMAAAVQLFFRLNGLTWWTETLRDGAALAHSHYMATQAGRAFDAIDPELRRMLGLYNIDAGKWDLLRMGQLQQADGRMYLTPEGLRTVPRAAYENYILQVGRTVNDATVSNLQDDLAQALRVMAIDRAHHAVLEPSARTRAWMLRGTRPGTVPGEILRYIGQFKSFSVAMVHSVLGREVYGRGYDTLGEYLRKGHGDMLGLAYMVGLYGVLGYGAMAAKDLLRGREPRDPLDPRTMMAALAQGGGLGLYGDFLFGEYSRMGRTFTASLAGPVLGNLDIATDLWTRLRNGDDLAAASFNALLQNTPFANLFWLRPVLNYLILYHIQEALNPGFLRRMEKRIERENGQTFLLPPSQVVR